MVLSALKAWNQHKLATKNSAGISPAKQLLQISVWMARGFTADEYYIYPLYSHDPRPVTCAKHYNRINPILNPRETGVIPVDKWIQSSIWKANQIPHPTVYGFTRSGSGILQGNYYNGDINTLRKFLSGLDFPLVIKPLDESNGRGFNIIEEFDQPTDALILRSGERTSLNHFHTSNIQSSEGVLFQALITQHPLLQTIFPHAINSLRVLTYRQSDGTYSVTQAIAKFGCGDAIIDNDAENGILSNINLNNGTLSACRKRLGCEIYSNHPDTGIRIEGLEMPYFTEAKALATKAHQHIPYPRYLGWDIAITPHGPLIIEPNSYVSIAVNQKLAGQQLEL